MNERIINRIAYLVFLALLIFIIIIEVVWGSCWACIGICTSHYCGIPSLSQKIECARVCGCPETFVYMEDALEKTLARIPLVEVSCAIFIAGVIFILVKDWLYERRFRRSLEAFIRREFNRECRYSVSDYIRYSIVAPIVAEALSETLSELVDKLYRIQNMASETTTMPVIAVRSSVRPYLHLSPYVYKVLNKPSPYMGRGYRGYRGRKPFLFMPLRRYLNHRYLRPKVVIIHG